MLVDISKVKGNNNNPRIIKDDKFRKLVKSIKEFPEMLELRPIVVDENYIVLGGNMRLKACIEAGLKEVNILIADNLTEDQKKEFIVKDNVGFGEWDWDMIANEWDTNLLEDWGLDLKLDQDIDKEFTNDVKITLSLNNEYLENFKTELDNLLSKYPNVLVKFKI
jgi:ParB-like chromosome segregation protein Spo0J